MEFEIINHWNYNFQEYFVIVRNNQVFCRNSDSDFFNLFKNEIINFEYMKNIYNCFIEDNTQYNAGIYFFKTKEDAEKCLDELLMPHIIMEKLTK